MIHSWRDLAFWFVTAFAGALLMKVIDLFASRHQEKHDRRRTKVDKVLEYVNLYGELTELFRLTASVSQKRVMSDDGTPKIDASGKSVIESRVLRPEPRLDEAIRRELKGSDIDTAIAQKIVMIRLKAFEAQDIMLELDPTGGLTDQFKNLYTKAVWEVEIVLKNRDLGEPKGKFQEMINALKEADAARRSFRDSLQGYQG